MSRVATGRVLATAAVLALVTGCSTPGPTSGGSTAAAGTTVRTSFQNCGHQVTLTGTPRRIVTIKSSATEAVLALGAGDLIVGTAAADGPLPRGLAYEPPPVISAEVPGAEAVLALSPDLVYAGWESNLTARSAGDRGRLARLGIATYVSPAACDQARHREDPLSFDDVFAEITEVADILGVPDAATELIARQRSELSAVPRSGDDRSALWFGAMIVTLMLPYHVLLIPQYLLFSELGWLDSFLPLVVPKFLATEAFFVFLLVQFFRVIPREMIEAARIDGCGHFRTFVQIILPLAVPALATTAAFSFIWAWNDFLNPLIYLTSPENYTVPIGLSLFVDASGSSNYGGLFAMSLLSLLPVIGFFAAFQKLLIEGISTTGLK